MLEPGKLAYGIKEVGRVINTGQSTVYEYIKEGRMCREARSAHPHFG